MKSQLKLVWLLLQMKLSRSMMFRFSFFGSLFVDGCMFLIQIATFSAIYAHVDTIGGWDRGQMLFFIGTFSLINALNMVVFFFGLNALPSKIQSGELDHYLTKPGSTLLRISLESIDLGSLPLVGFSLALLGYAVGVMGARPGAGQVLGYLALTLIMLLLWYDLMLILRTIPFFVIRASAIDRLEGELIGLCLKIPGQVFRGGFRLVFCVLLPYGLMATLPTECFTGQLAPAGYLYGLGIVAAFTAFALAFFRFGLRHYKSASS